MILFHNSNDNLTKLVPKVGSSRHSGEDPRAVGKPVVWLSNKPQLDQSSMKYRYEVEISENDPDLMMDEPFAKLQQDFAKMFNMENNWRWYFCFRELDINATYEFDSAIKDYVRV